MSDRHRTGWKWKEKKKLLEEHKAHLQQEQQQQQMVSVYFILWSVLFILLLIHLGFKYDQCAHIAEDLVQSWKMNKAMSPFQKCFTYSESSVLKSDFSLLGLLQNNSSVCIVFSVVKICSGEVTDLVSLKLCSTYSLNKQCKFKVSAVFVDHILANAVTNSLLEYFWWMQSIIW